MLPLSDAQRDLVERIGVVHDRMGMRPAAGRIIGLLLVTSDSELTFDEIRDTLMLSKSATSTSLRLLQEVGSVVYRTRPGDRKRYFRKDLDDWEARFVERAMGFLDIRGLLREAMEMKCAEASGSRPALEQMVAFLDHMAGAIRDVQAGWPDRGDPPIPRHPGVSAGAVGASTPERRTG